MTFEVQQTRWDRLIRRVSGSIGPGSRVSETLSELFPMVDVERVPGELLALGGTKLCIGSAIVIAVVGETSRIQLFNPIDSGNIISVTFVGLSTNASLDCNFAVRNFPLTTETALERYRDSRFPAPQRPVGQIRIANTVAQTDPDGILRLANNLFVQIVDPNELAILIPGSGYEFGTATQNVPLRCSFRWRERPAEESELSL